MKGILLILTGPSGCGKTTLCHRLVKTYAPNLSKVTTTTTRPQRPGEAHGVDYYFLTPEAFEQKRQAGAFLEHAQVYQYSYGTLKESIYEPLRAGKDLVLSIDVQGATSFQRMAEEDPVLKNHLVTLFIKPPTLEEIQRRLQTRGTDSPETINRRLKMAQEEMKQATCFHHCITSGTKEADFQAVNTLYQSEKAAAK